MKKKKKTDDVADFAGGPAPTVLGAAEVQQKEFRINRVGAGYNMRDVDEFLDQITGSMNATMEEIRVLRNQGGGSLVGAPDLADSARQADEIIQRARAQAEQIVRDAQAQAGALGAAAVAGAGTPVDRAPVNAFLAQERSFLQSLGQLVQEHAETVKGMVRVDRGSASPPLAAARRSAQSTPQSPPRTATRPPAPAETAPSRRPTSDPRSTVPIAKVEEPIRVEEPTTASARREDDSSGEGQDRSLRELFWGED
ncbi:MAG: DivIVA protein [Actinomycetota bacterium]|jgi:DivIVA domain-containing protein|nr:DivIVA protein [Actinomycetota bacterium]